MYDAAGALRDQIYQGKMILLAIGGAYLTFWIVAYFCAPTMLVPGFLLDRSGASLWQLIGLVSQLAILGILWMLTWAGYAWARYVLSVFLLIGGMSNVILSIMLNSAGGPQLIFGAVGLASAAALAVSLNVHRYAEDRRQRGLPALQIGLGILGVYAVLFAVVAIQALQLWSMVETDRAETAYANQVLNQVMPAFDLEALTRVASDNLKHGMLEADFAGQFAQVREKAGAFQAWKAMAPSSLETLVVNPARVHAALVYSTVAKYEKLNLEWSLTFDFSKQPYQVTDVIFLELPKAPAK